jgi:hypothetical protein
MHRNSPFTDVQTAIEEIRTGRMVVVVDDEDRENEGDLTMAAEMITPEAINFMAKYGRGLICLAMTPERLDHLRLQPMSIQNTARFGTAFTESIDAGPRCYYRDLRLRPRRDDSVCNRSPGAPFRPWPPRPCVSVTSTKWRSAGSGWADRSIRGLMPVSRFDACRRDLRNHERRREYGASAGSYRFLQRA